ncbi:MAG TPA: ubiquinol-cytochrome C chaperone family protein [Rhizomicrobium sp.]|jgi:cytochrome b pre-mRNA-processing protein 3|nr:ubiquinol-cytochrome C chaperone family protein [Rhizomicrobium sp.]
MLEGRAMLKAFRERSRRNRIAGRMCDILSARAREPVFFRDFGVPDTFDGRFDLLVLHAWLALERLQAEGERELAQSFVDALFVRLDDALREQGAGDIGMSRRMKKMAGAFYGRLEAYSAAGDETALAAALARNLYRGAPARVEHAAGLAKYASGARVRLLQCRLNDGRLDFGPVGGPAEAHGR